MTECPKCKGYGIVGSAVPDILRGRGHIFSSIECPQCNGTGEVPMTNEEYLKSCTTEQLADVFFDYRYINATPQQQLWLSANEDFVKGGIAEWLKQPNTTIKE